MKLKQLQEKVKNQLPPTRYEHTLGVVRTSEILAEKYHVLLESAQVAALLHDIAKYLPNNELEEKLIAANEMEYLNLSLIHI